MKLIARIKEDEIYTNTITIYTEEHYNINNTNYKNTPTLLKRFNEILKTQKLTTLHKKIKNNNTNTQINNIIFRSK